LKPVDHIQQEPTAPTVTQPEAPSIVIKIAKVRPAKASLPEVPSKNAVEALLTRPSFRLQPATLEGRPVEACSESGKVRRRKLVGRATLEGRPVEACSGQHGRLVAEVTFHPVIAAIHLAFNDHRPLVLSPDMFWLLIAQGLANHVNANSEELRSRFIEHSGKVEIAFRRDDFIKSSPDNPWPEVLSEFSREIRGYIGEATHDLLLPDFSTTGVVERAAAEVVLLDAMQSFFRFFMRSMCGIPQIRLEGTPADWERLAERTKGIGQFGLSWWTEVLGPILDEFVAASRGKANARFWRSIYKVDDSSGGPYITGWITAFFPYLKCQRTEALGMNPWLLEGGKRLQSLLSPEEEQYRRSFRDGPTTESFLVGLAGAPFQWDYFSRSIEMEFFGGFIGVRQDQATLELRPEIGWAVREQGVPERD